MCSNREHLFASTSARFLNRDVMPINGRTGSINFVTSCNTLRRSPTIQNDSRATLDAIGAIVAATRPNEGTRTRVCTRQSRRLRKNCNARRIESIDTISKLARDRFARKSKKRVTRRRDRSWPASRDRGNVVEHEIVSV